jgi:hypothetical protein
MPFIAWCSVEAQGQLYLYLYCYTGASIEEYLIKESDFHVTVKSKKIIIVR